MVRELEMEREGELEGRGGRIQSATGQGVAGGG